MAFTVLPQRSTGAERFGTGLGSGLANVLSNLAQQKLTGIQERARAEQVKPGLQALRQLAPQTFGRLQDQDIEMLSSLPEKELNTVLKQLLQQPLISAPGTEQVSSVLGDIISGRQPEMGQPLPEQLGEPGVGESLKYAPLETPSQKEVDNLLAEKKPTMEMAAIKDEGLSKIDIPLSPGARGALEVQRMEERLRDPRLSPLQKESIRDQVEKREDRFLKQQEKIDKANQKYIEDLDNQYQSAIETDRNLKEMKELVLSGELPSPGTAAVLDLFEKGIPVLGIGLNLKGVFLSREGQQFEKNATDFITKIRGAFGGGRIAAQTLKLYLKRVPSLLQSDEGKLSVINTMRKINEITQLKWNAKRDIIQENLGFQPKNINLLVEERTKDEAKKIIQSFNDQIKKDLQQLKPVQEESRRRKRERAKDIASKIGPSVL